MCNLWLTQCNTDPDYTAAQTGLCTCPTHLGGKHAHLPKRRHLNCGLSTRQSAGFFSGSCYELRLHPSPSPWTQTPALPATLAPTAMVTQSKFLSMSRALDSSLRLKTFSSRGEYNLVLGAVRKLQESGFYWSTVTGSQANLLLGAEPPGTFLIRDSSDRRHFFTLSVKTESGTKNLRIQCEPGGFSLQTDARSAQPVPRFDCVLKLLRHYMPAKDPGSNAKRVYYIYSGGERVPLLLSRPLSSAVSSLQHLCRKAVNGQVDTYEAMVQLPVPIRDFLQEYDSPI